LTESGNNDYLKYISLGSEIAVGLTVPILLGYWIDHYTGLFPWFTLAGIASGIAIMIAIMIRLSRSMGNGNNQ